MEDNTHPLEVCQKYSQALFPIKQFQAIGPAPTRGDDLRSGASEPADGEAVEGRPCLYSNNSTGYPERVTPQTVNEVQKVEAISALTTLLTPYHKKAAQTLYLNVSRLVNEVPNIGHIAFLTLTFKDNVTDHREAYRRYRSWNSHFFAKNPEYGYYINTKEVQVRGAWHYHILVQLKGDIREGFDFEAYREWLEGNNRFNKQCPTGNSYLKALWADLKENLEPYGLGHIHSLEPIESTVEAISRYVGKYISKHIGNRTEEQKGVRLVNYSRGWVRNSVNFAWNTENSMKWRRKLAKFAKYIGCEEMYQINETLGPGWVHRYLEEIMNIDITMLEKIINDKAEFGQVHFPEFKSNTTENILRNKETRESKMREELTIHYDRKKQKIAAESKLKVNLAQNEIKTWLTPDLAIKIGVSLKKDKEEQPLKQAKRNYEAVQRMRDAVEGMMISEGKEIDLFNHKTYTQHGEEVPF